MTTAVHLNSEELEAGLDEIRQSPKQEGTLEMIVRRPETLQRDIVQEGELNPDVGLVGDNWKTRGGPERPANPETQITLTNARAIQHIAQSKDLWALAGDQLYVDLDITEANLHQPITLGHFYKVTFDACMKINGVTHSDRCD